MMMMIDSLRSNSVLFFEKRFEILNKGMNLFYRLVVTNKPILEELTMNDFQVIRIKVLQC